MWKNENKMQQKKKRKKKKKGKNKSFLYYFPSLCNGHKSGVVTDGTYPWWAPDYSSHPAPHPLATHPATNQALHCLTSNIDQTHFRVAVKASSYS